MVKVLRFFFFLKRDKEKGTPKKMEWLKIKLLLSFKRKTNFVLNKTHSLPQR